MIKEDLKMLGGVYMDFFIELMKSYWFLLVIIVGLSILNILAHRH